MLVERVTRFVRGASRETFEELALAVFRAQYERGGPLRELCDRLGATPDRLSDWREVPAMEAVDGPPSEDGPLVELRRAVADRSFRAACLRGLDRPPVLSLIPTGDDAPDPGSAFLARRVLDTLAAPESLAAAGRGVEVAKARSFLGARQRDRRPTLVLGTGEALDRLLEALDRRGLRFRLPPGSRVVAAARRGGADGVPLARLAEGLGVPPEAVVVEYAVPGVVTRLYVGHGPRGNPLPFVPPTWARARILDAAGRDELPAGAAGAIAVFDLASVSATAHRLTGDRGTAAGGGFLPAG